MSQKLLEGKKAIITGGSSGIGEAIAYEFAKQGAIVGLIARRVEKMNAIVDTIQKNGGKAFFEKADVRFYDQVKNAVNILVEKMSGLDILIPNAGVNIMTCNQRPSKAQVMLDDLSSSTYDALAKYIDNMIDVNLKGVFYTINAGLFHMAKQNSGRIISTSSVMALKGYIMEPYYTSTKAGIVGLTQGYEKLLNKFKITFNSILPIGVKSEMMAKLDYGNLVPANEIAPFYVFFGTEDGKKENAKLVNHDTFMSALKIIKEIPEGNIKSWTELEPILTEKMSQNDFKHIKDNRKLLMFLLKYKIN